MTARAIFVSLLPFALALHWLILLIKVTCLRPLSIMSPASDISFQFPWGDANGRRESRQMVSPKVHMESTVLYNQSSGRAAGCT